jgi:NAD(P)-dependent dehydrogenase (short-subunit alcohol dehydrogenase family)
MAQIAITGANRGIGLALAALYRERGDQVLALVRRSSAKLEATGATVVEGIDVGSTDSVAGLGTRADLPELDLLLNVAGILGTESFEKPDWPNRIRRQFDVNAIGPLAVTLALRSHLVPGSRVAILSSFMGSLADNSSGGYYGYRMSKAAANMVGVNLAHELRRDGIAVFLLHPGYIRTAMTSGQGTKDAATAAAELAALLDRLTLAETGTFWHAEGRELPW